MIYRSSAIARINTEELLRIRYSLAAAGWDYFEEWYSLLSVSRETPR